MPANPETLARLIGSTVASLQPQRRELFERFASWLLRGVEAHHVGGDPALAAMASEAFAFAQQRAPGELRVRVSNPEDRPGHTLLEVLQDDHPFIVDTLRLELRKVTAHERIVIHPLLPVLRDAEGRMVAIRDSANSGPLDSYVYLEFAPRLERAEQRQALEQSVHEVMSWVLDVTVDHRKMILAMRELIANLEYASPALEGGMERGAKIERFLEWLVDGRFIFVGLRRYRVGTAGDEIEAQIVPGTGLGMWRSDASSRLQQARRGAEIPAEMREDMQDPRIILISKSQMESRIHRGGRLDRIVVKEHDERGRVTGFTTIVGLFTQRVLRTPGSQIPLLSERLQEILKRQDVSYGSHRHQSIVTVFDSAPVELLIAMDVENLSDLVEELLEASSSKSVRLVTRSNPHGRALYAAVVLPREHYREDLRGEIRTLLEQRTGAVYIDDRTSFVGEGAAIVHCFCSSAQGERLEPDLVALEEQVRTICSPWEDQLLDALRELHGDQRGSELAARYEHAFPEALRVATHPFDAARDVAALEALSDTGQPQFALWFDRGDARRETATLRIYLQEPPLLSDILPVATRFDLSVVDAQLASVKPVGRPAAAVESLRIVPFGAEQGDLDAILPRLGSALGASLTHSVASDALNALVIGAGLDWRQVDLMRGLLEYFVQIQGTLSRPYLRKVLLENPLAVRLLVRYFETRFDPDLDDDERERRQAFLRDAFQTYRDRIKALNEDRALQGFTNIIEAMLRTNFFAEPATPHRISFKLDSTRIKDLTGVIPHREIFVHSAAMTGVHLRGGPVARGGIRFSDRHDDLRLEILGLMSTQMLKNGLIVPVGAKGGFILRTSGLSPSEARAEADVQYRVFISSLLDLTDNLAADGSLIAPAGVRRLDDDDPYLVVAADKGTAHLSDTANEIALARDFWLGDAFASGGSEGYDHKKYAITARGAWACALHHFAELGIDPERDPYSVAGIGDMSGDVFGNGLLLARRGRLLAAFDHRHIFLDPDPDPETAWQERKRLFELPRSCWADYSVEALSKGGGVWPRGSKSIPVPDSLRERLRLGPEDPNGQTLVRAILAMDVDLLWNGGIGTYVKASHESHADVADHANDAVRIDASALRARVLVEGGNLGLSQAARVEAALLGVRLNTDAIDNSAGVDLSDHEVNYKVALAPLVRSGQLAPGARRQLLFDVVDTACESVLSHNRAQALSLSLDELRSKRNPEIFLRAIEILTEHARLDPAELRLPDAVSLAERAERGFGLTRPELAVLLGLAKLQAQALLRGCELLARPELAALLTAYFPARFANELPDALAAHPLRGEISALGVVNRLVDAGGATLFSSLVSELGVDVPVVALAMLQAGEILRLSEIRARLIEGLNSSRQGGYAALIELDEGVRSVARFLIRSESGQLEGERTLRWRDGLDALAEAIEDYLAPGELRRVEARRDRLLEQGVAADLADSIAALPLADRGLNILRICEQVPVVPLEAARTYARLGEEAGMNWIYDRLSQAPVTSVWDRMVLVDLRSDVLDLQSEITRSVLEAGSGDPATAIASWLADHADAIARIDGLQRRAAAGASPSALTVITGELRSLRPTAAKD